MRVRRIAAFDPGRNIGFAMLDDAGRLLEQAILDEEGVRLLEVDADAVVVGSGTGSDDLVALLRAKGVTPTVVDETNTTLAARRHYFRDHPPRGLQRLLPEGMRAPPRPIDDYAAYAIGLRYLAELRSPAGDEPSS